MSLQSSQIYVKPSCSIYSNYYMFLSSHVSYKIHIAAVCFYREHKLCKYILPDKICNSLVMVQALHQRRRDPVQCINSTETLHSLWTPSDPLQNTSTIKTVKTSEVVTITLPRTSTTLTGSVSSKNCISPNVHSVIPVLIETQKQTKKPY